MNTINGDLDNNCRICLQYSEDMMNLFTADCKYKLIIEDFTGIKLEQEPEISSMICNKCADTINILLEFKATCIKSHEFLKNRGTNTKIKTESNKFTAIEQKDEIENNKNDSGIFIDIILKKELNYDSSNEDIIQSESENSGDNNVRINKKKRSDMNEKRELKKDSNDSGRRERITRSTRFKNSASRQIEIQKSPKKPKELSMKTIKTKVKPTGSTKLEKTEQLQENPSCSNPEINKTKKYDMSCHICGKLYSKFKIEYHINSHLDIRPFICEITECKKGFSSPDLLRQHHKHCHSDYAPHKCDICGKGFKGSAALKMHKTYHSDPELPCSVCGKLLRNRKSLRVHMFHHTGERPYKCDECLKCFKNQSTLKVHRTVVHTKKKPFICKICGLSFGYSYQVKQHKDKHHPEDISYDNQNTGD